MTKTLKPPYTSVSDIDAFFERIETIAEPQPPKKVDSAWVESYQFKTAHPSAIPAMLRWLAVIDEDGESAGVWNELRVDGTRQATLARLVKEAYDGVFDAIDVEKATARDLRGGFVSAYSIGDPARQIKCFLALCRHAGIPTTEEASARERERNGNAKKRRKSDSTSNGSSKREVTARHKPRRKDASEPTEISITLNVEIPAAWTDGEIRQRITAVRRALEPADPSDT